MPGTKVEFPTSCVVTLLGFSMVKIGLDGKLATETSGTPLKWLRLEPFRNETRDLLRLRYPHFDQLSISYLMALSSGHWRTLEAIDNILLGLKNTTTGLLPQLASLSSCFVSIAGTSFLSATLLIFLFISDNNLDQGRPASNTHNGTQRG